jgi:hypothetical protein
MLNSITINKGNLVMNIKKLVLAGVMAATTLGVGVANAATYNLVLPAFPAVGLETPGSFTVSLFAPVADSNATLDFVIQGYRTLDGNNQPSYQDIFSLDINGSTVGSGSFNLGGGGTSDSVFGIGPNAGTAVTSNTESNYFKMPNAGQGGTTTITGLKFNLLGGQTNTFTFAYAGNSQGIGDEGWSIASASVTAVPEPEVYGMMLMGLGLMTFVTIRRKNNQS